MYKLFYMAIASTAESLECRVFICSVLKKSTLISFRIAIKRGSSLQNKENIPNNNTSKKGTLETTSEICCCWYMHVVFAVYHSA